MLQSRVESTNSTVLCPINLLESNDYKLLTGGIQLRSTARGSSVISQLLICWLMGLQQV